MESNDPENFGTELHDLGSSPIRVPADGEAVQDSANVRVEVEETTPSHEESESNGGRFRDNDEHSTRSAVVAPEAYSDPGPCSETCFMCAEEKKLKISNIVGSARATTNLRYATGVLDAKSNASTRRVVSSNNPSDGHLQGALEDILQNLSRVVCEGLRVLGAEAANVDVEQGSREDSGSIAQNTDQTHGVDGSCLSMRREEPCLVMDSWPIKTVALHEDVDPYRTTHTHIKKAQMNSVPDIWRDYFPPSYTDSAGYPVLDPTVRRPLTNEVAQALAHISCYQGDPRRPLRRIVSTIRLIGWRLIQTLTYQPVFDDQDIIAVSFDPPHFGLIQIGKASLCANVELIIRLISSCSRLSVNRILPLEISSRNYAKAHPLSSHLWQVLVHASMTFTSFCLR
ncbi:uncharacterized protein LY89DRAFT_119214 [Mollisia scopiformis]|uniref:Uncharacterized protein n=1 Tax=Mollisia scopiformis TaxID=149040 RepID=A0A194X3A1_MOLSC|nr:uncharacterized protein LY89DRAFT_119214 [Mollisia scopiformis]KUJ14680.1 hypothetical protein LY89DRAFT_119214 [Mollisia scopiformis]